MPYERCAEIPPVFPGGPRVGFMIDHVARVICEQFRQSEVEDPICSSIKQGAASNISEQGFAVKKREVNTARFRSSFISSASSDADFGFSNQGVIQKNQEGSK
jgi:hypothetical protein